MSFRQSSPRRSSQPVASRQEKSVFRNSVSKQSVPVVVEIIDSDEDSSEPDWEEYSFAASEVRFFGDSLLTLREEDEERYKTKDNQKPTQPQSNIWTSLQSTDFLADQLFGSACGFGVDRVSRSQKTKASSQTLIGRLFGRRKTNDQIYGCGAAEFIQALRQPSEQHSGVPEIRKTHCKEAASGALANAEGGRRSSTHTESPEYVMEKLHHFVSSRMSKNGTVLRFQHQSVPKTTMASECMDRIMNRNDFGAASFDSDFDWSPSDSDDENEIPVVEQILQVVRSGSEDRLYLAKKSTGRQDHSYRSTGEHRKSQNHRAEDPNHMSKQAVKKKQSSSVQKNDAHSESSESSAFHEETVSTTSYDLSTLWKDDENSVVLSEGDSFSVEYRHSNIIPTCGAWQATDR